MTKTILQNTKIKGYTAAILSAFLLGSLGIFVRNISANAYTITFSRLVISWILLICYMTIKKEIQDIRNTRLPGAVVATGILLAGASICYINTITRTTLANAVFLVYLGPLLAAGIAALILKEKLTSLSAGLIGSAFFGLLCLLEFNFTFDTNESQGYLWGVGAAGCFALYIVFNRMISKSVSSLVRVFYQFLFGALTLIPFLDASIFNVTGSDMFWLTGIGLFQGFLAVTLVTVAIKHLKTVEYGTISYVEPIVASLIGFFCYDEHFTFLQFIGCAIVFCGGIAQVLSSKEGI